MITELKQLKSREIPLTVVALEADGVDFVDKDDGRGILIGDAEELANELWTIAEVFLNQF
jgi:hypothetical protein